MVNHIDTTTASPMVRPRVNATSAFSVSDLRDTHARPLRDLRISVTDQCNFRCTYCMPRSVFGPDYEFLSRQQLLSFEEIYRFARTAVAHGVQKIRLTGGEPLLRKGIEQLIEQLSGLRTPGGEPVHLTLTTNGTLLKKKARSLYEAGLSRVTVSLDALDPVVFERMSDSGLHVQQVLDGIDAAAQVGLAPVKVNMVVRKGMNDDQIMPMIEYFRNSGHILRFIEFMDVGCTNDWSLADVITGRQILDLIQSRYSLEPVDAAYRGEVAERWRFLDGAGELGVITSVSHPFCSDCSRLRLSPEGKLFLCLFASRGHDIRGLLRSGASDEDVARALAGIWGQRTDRYSELRGMPAMTRDKVEMSYIGG